MRDRPCCIWLTGLPAAGKSTVAEALKQELQSAGAACCVLDGDCVREGLCRDLGYSAADRAENVRRISEVARLMVDAGLIAIVSLISPFRKDRLAARARFAAGTFIEVYVDTPLDVCERRDPKALYRKARLGDIPDFTGVSSAYEPPEQPDVRLVHDRATPYDHVAMIITHLRQHGFIEST